MIQLNERYSHPRYLVKGVEVFIPFYVNNNLVGLRCKVLCAAGNCGRLINKEFKIDRWVKLEDMAVFKESALAK